MKFKREMIRRIGALLLLVAVLMTGCSDRNEATGETSQGESLNLNGYTIIRREQEGENVISVISAFYTKLKQEKKINVSFGVDEEVDAGEKEILIGATNRSEDRNLRYSDFSIEHKEGKIYINGGSADAIKAATEWLCSECLSDGTLELKKLPYTYEASYPLADLKVCGVSLSEFAVEESTVEEMKALKQWIGPKAGTRKVSENGYQIKLVEDSDLYLDEVSIELIGKDLFLSASSHLDQPGVAAEYFLTTLTNFNGNSLDFSKNAQIELPKPPTSLKNVNDVDATTKCVLAKAQNSYQVGDEAVIVCTLSADGKVVSCPKFTWTAMTSDGKSYSGEATGAFGKLVIKIPVTGAGEIRLKVLARNEDGSLISCVDQSEDMNENPIFKFTVKNEEGDSLYMKEIPECFETTPIVYAVNRDYQIMVPVKQETLMWVEVDGKCFYDDVNGVLRSNTSVHKMTVPMALLDAAGEYKICYRIVNTRKPYNSSVSDVYEYTSVFKAVTSENPRFFQIADAHNKVDEPVAAAKAFGEMDFLILNGDIPNDAGDVKNFLTIHMIASEVTNGEIPVVFSRGNHDMRGIYAENLSEYTPTDGGNSFFTFRLGPVWGIVLDCGEDKPDNHVEYGSTVCCEAFRKRQIEFLNDVIVNAENEYNAEGVKYRMVVSHDPFTEYLPNRVTEEDLATYTEWARLLREYVKPDVMVCGHVHSAYITEVGDALDRLGQPCPVVVGSASGTSDKKHDGWLHVRGVYIATGFEWRGDELLVDFVGHNGIVYQHSVIS